MSDVFLSSRLDSAITYTHINDSGPVVTSLLYRAHLYAKQANGYEFPEQLEGGGDGGKREKSKIRSDSQATDTWFGHFLREEQSEGIMRLAE